MTDTASHTVPHPSAAIPHPSHTFHRDTPPATPPVAIPECLRIGMVRTRGGALVRLEGELDVAGAPALTSVLARCMKQPGSITVDASGLVFIDAAGVRPLADAQALCHRRGRNFRLMSASVPVRRVITLARLADRLLGDEGARAESGGEAVAA